MCTKFYRLDLVIQVLIWLLSKVVGRRCVINFRMNSEWAMTVVECANMGEKLVPGEVVFSLENGKYYADIL